MDEKESIITVITLCIILSAFTFWMGAILGENNQKRILLNTGLAEYTVNKKTGETRFRYIYPDTEPKNLTNK